MPEPQPLFYGVKEGLYSNFKGENLDSGLVRHKGELYFSVKVDGQWYVSQMLRQDLPRALLPPGSRDAAIFNVGETSIFGAVKMTGFQLTISPTNNYVLTSDANGVGTWKAVPIDDHGTLSGLTDDDHTQYALLAGRFGGQIFTGDTTNNGDLTLRSTTGSVKGDIFLNDQGGNIGIGTTDTMKHSGVMGSSALYITIHHNTINLPSVLELATDTASSDVGVGAVQFVNDNNTDAVNLDADSKLVSTIACVLEGNSPDSGGHLRFYTKPEAGSVVEHVRIAGDGKVGINETSPKTILTLAGTLTLKEQAAADADTATYGQLWVKNTSPNELWFTDDVGTDTHLGLSDHGALSGLSDDDHTQYALLLGRTNGQTLTGATAANKNLALNSTSHATKGNVVLQGGGGNVIIGPTGGAKFLGLGGSSAIYTNINGSTTGKSILELTRNSSESENIAGIHFVNDNNTAASDLLAKSKLLAAIVCLSETPDSNAGDDSGGHLLIYTKSEGVGSSVAERMRITSDGNLGIGLINPAQKLDVVGTVQMTGFKLPTSPTDGFVLTSDAAGVGTWQAAGGGGANGWVDDGTVVRLETITDKVGIGTASPGEMLTVAGIIESTTGGFKVGSFEIPISETTVTTSKTELILEETGDALGTVRLALRARGGGGAGLTIETAGTLDLVDCQFQVPAGTVTTIRYEARAGKNEVPNATKGFQFGLRGLGAPGNANRWAEISDKGSLFKTGPIGIKDGTETRWEEHIEMRAGRDNLNDNQAFDYTIGTNNAILFITMEISGANLENSAIIALRNKGSADRGISIISSSGAIFEVTQGNLTGTTGTDGKVTLSVGDTSGKLWIENRHGASRKFEVFIIFGGI